MGQREEMPVALDALEIRCLSLAGRGRTHEDISIETDITAERITAALESAMRKLQAENLGEAVYRAARIGLIS